MSKEYKHSEQLKPDHKGQKRFKISYEGYVNKEKRYKKVRAYKILYADDPEDALKRADLYKPIIYDITEI